MGTINHPIVGHVSYGVGNKGRLILPDGWVSANISTAFVPQLRGVQTYGGKFSGKVRFFKPAIPQLVAAFAEVERLGLSSKILFWDGSFVPRLKRGGSTPSNHCLPAGETVWTPDGAKLIEELRDYTGLVWSYKDGEVVPRRMVGFFDNGIAPIVRVNCVGHSFRCTANHKVLVLRKKTLSKSEWVQHSEGRGQKRAEYWTEMVEAGQLRSGDRIIALRQLPETGIFEADAAWAETLGLFIGDGCVGHRKGDPEYVSFSIPKEDRIREHSINVLTRCFGVAPKIHDRALIYYQPHIVARFEPYDKYAREKTIPSEVWNWSKSSQIKFVLGYLYSDGTAAKTPAISGDGFGVRYRFKAGSVCLIKDLKLLLTGLGFRCSRIHIEKPEDRVICNVPTRSNGAWHFSGVDVKGILEPYADSVYADRANGARQPKQGDSHCWGYEAIAPDFTHHCIQSVVGDGEERVYDIEVEDTHNFITDGAVVSNSWGTAFDINAEWNGFRRRPARVGAKGDLHAVADVIKRFGFSWGGDWKSADGMHFEVNRIMSQQEIATARGKSTPAKTEPALILATKGKDGALTYHRLSGAELKDGAFLVDRTDVLAALAAGKRRVEIRAFLESLGAKPYDEGNYLSDPQEPRMYLFVDTK